MSSELAVIETVTTQVDPTGGRLVAWAKAADAAHKLAVALCKTTFVPETMQNKDGDAAAAILMGDELGFSPLASLNSIYIIKGKPALYGRAMVALLQSQGHEIWTEESSPSKVIVKGRRKGSDHIETSTWDIARATTAGYTSNAKYKTNPQEMLYAKAASEIARKIGADVLLGIPYSVEDLELEESTTTTLQRGGAEPTTPTRVARKVKEKGVIPAPLLDGEEADEVDEAVADAAGGESETDEVAVSVVIASEAQIKKMGAQMRELGMSDRDIALAYVKDLIGREIESRSDLTREEASKVIDALDAKVRAQ